MYNEKDILAKWNAEMYDREETETDDAAFLLSLMGGTAKRVLEIACGSGRLLVPVAQAGHEAMGLDFDEFMLRRLEKKAAGIKNIAWHRADVIREDWGGGYDVLILGANFLFNIVSDMDYEQAQALMIRKAAEALVPGGHVFIDYAYTRDPERWFNRPQPVAVWQGEDSEGNTGAMTLLHNTYDQEARMARFVRRMELTTKDGSRVVQERAEEKHFPALEQGRIWLRDAGFTVERECGDYQGRPIGAQTSRAILWAGKR